MSIQRLLDYQRILDEKIIEKNRERGQNVLDNYSLEFSKKGALILEYFEFLNETKLVKYWSTSRIDEESLKEEFIDMLHFTLSLILQYGRTELLENWRLGFQGGEEGKNLYLLSQDNFRLKQELLNISLDWAREIYDSLEAERFSRWLGWMQCMSRWLGMSLDEIEERYTQKWEINLRRLNANI